MEDWDAIRNEISSALSEIGVGAFIVKKGKQTGAENRPSFVESRYHQCTVIYSKWSYHHIDGSLIRASDKKITLSSGGLDIMPALGDEFWDGIAKQDGKPVLGKIVEPLEILSPSGIALKYTLNLRY